MYRIKKGRDDSIVQCRRFQSIYRSEAEFCSFQRPQDKLAISTSSWVHSGNALAAYGPSTPYISCIRTAYLSNREERYWRRSTKPYEDDGHFGPRSSDGDDT
ncbi:hypothetical protein TNCV_226311 [Trichonephila clavipes]|nr:hypothetical protein TNCV_226311 [Trichonephila clavipes]